MALRLSFTSLSAGIVSSVALVTSCGGSSGHRNVLAESDGAADGALFDSRAPGTPDSGVRDSGRGTDASGASDASGLGPEAGTGGGRNGDGGGRDGSLSGLDATTRADAADASGGSFVPGVVGTGLPSLESVACPIRIAVDAAGTPTVAYVNSTTSLIEVSKLTGATWTPIGGPTMAGTYANSFCHALALEPNGNPVVAFTEFFSASTTYQIQVQRLAGTTWQPLGAPFPSTYYISTSEIAADATGRVVLATSFGSSVDVRRWDDVGKAWTPIGSPFFRVQAQVGVVRVVLKPDGNPVVAWSEGIGGSNAASIYVAEYDGAQWNQLGGALDSIPSATQSLSPPSIAYDGAPVVAWGKYTGLARVLGVQRWNGSASAWVDMTPPPETNPQYSRVAIHSAGGRITLAWGFDGGNVYQQYDGVSWGAVTPFYGPSMDKIPEPLLAMGGGRLFMSHQGAGNQGFVLRMPLP